MNILYYTSLDSSNDEAKRLIKKGLNEKTSIITKVQTQGRGQLGRRWDSQLGGLYYTYIHPHPFKLNNIKTLQLKIVGLVSQIIQNITGITCQIKAPNDLYYDGKKCAGILLESSSRGCDNMAQYAIIGIGLNLNQNDFPGELNATSLSQILNKEIDFKPFVNHFHKELSNVF